MIEQLRAVLTRLEHSEAVAKLVRDGSVVTANLTRAELADLVLTECRANRADLHAVLAGLEMTACLGEVVTERCRPQRPPAEGGKAAGPGSAIRCESPWAGLLAAVAGTVQVPKAPRYEQHPETKEGVPACGTRRDRVTQGQIDEAVNGRR